MRQSFEFQLAELNEELILMGALCEDSIAAAMKALSDDDIGMADAAGEAERKIDAKEREIENICMRLLMRQQPVARDLRLVSSAMRMISDMERIGDQASDIADIARFIKGSGAKDLAHIYEMGVQAVTMVTESVDSFVRRDLTLAKKVILHDDIVDAMFADVRTRLVDIIVSRPQEAAVCLDLLMAAKYLERIGDHAVNIAEWVEYSITGIYKGELMV